MTYEQVRKWTLDSHQLPLCLEDDGFERSLQQLQEDLSKIGTDIDALLQDEDGDDLAVFMKRRWFQLDPDLTFLAHGSYGATLRICSEAARRYTEITERQPVTFFYKILYPELVRSLHAIAPLFRTTADNLVFVSNVEFGINAVLGSILGSSLAPAGCRVATWQFTYTAVRQTLAHYADRVAVSVDLVEADLRAPDAQLLQKLRLYLAETRPCLFATEHITSPTAVVLPLKKICALCREFDCLVLVDAAHSLGSLVCDPVGLGCDFYATNGHKWLGNTRGCGVLYTRAELQPLVHPAVGSWGLGSSFAGEFIWQGTGDYSPWLTMRFASAAWELLGGLAAVAERNHRLASTAGRLLAEAWHTELLVPTERCCSMVVVRAPTTAPLDLHDRLLRQRIEVPCFQFQGTLWLRISIHLYNGLSDVARLRDAVLQLST